MASPSSVRHRPPKSSSSAPSDSKPLPSPPTSKPLPEEPKSDISFSFLDILRIVAGVLLLNTALSYFITSDSFFWGYPRPWFLRLNQVAWFLKGPLLLTDADLLRYNGSNPTLPILVAVNGTIFDVTASAGTYGPGGSYSFFSGRDASRAFVTGCFSESNELCWDMRGVEEMYVPLDDEEIDAGLSSGQRKVRREQELREGRKQVQKQVQHWEDFFRTKNNKGYFEVGRVIGRKSVEETFGKKRELCGPAKEARPKRKKAAVKKIDQDRDHGGAAGTAGHQKKKHSHKHDEDGVGIGDKVKMQDSNKYGNAPRRDGPLNSRDRGGDMAGKPDWV